jgi:hypothetical protein
MKQERTKNFVCPGCDKPTAKQIGDHQSNPGDCGPGEIHVECQRKGCGNTYVGDIRDFNAAARMRNANFRGIDYHQAPNTLASIKKAFTK